MPWQAPCADDDNEEECTALMTIANHTGFNVSWKDAEGWARGGSYCTWYGVVCDAKKEHVTELYLDGNNLTGPILGWEGLIWYCEQSFCRLRTQVTPLHSTRTGLRFYTWRITQDSTVPSLTLDSSPSCG